MSSSGACKVFAAAMVVQQNTFFLYHRNSYANNAAMLRSPKPLIMRDIFLTRAHYTIANPLSVLYVPTVPDMFVNATTAAIYGLGLPLVAGIRNVFAVWVLGGWVAGMAWLFQINVNKKRLKSEFDVTATSNGGWAAVSAYSLFFPAARMPFSNTRLHYFAFLHLMWTFFDEYGMPMLFPTPDHVAQVYNAGVIGGAFTGLMLGSLFVRRRFDANQLNKFMSNVPPTTKV